MYSVVILIHNRERVSVILETDADLFCMINYADRLHMASVSIQQTIFNVDQQGERCISTFLSAHQRLGMKATHFAEQDLNLN